MGSGGLVVLDENTCMVDLAKFFMEFIQSESCGKCIPCREGTRRMLEILKSITHNRKHEAGIDPLLRMKGVMLLQELGESIRRSSLCGLGQTAPNPVLSTLKYFRGEYEAHIQKKQCPALVCRTLVRYEIDPGACVQCGQCETACPSRAIGQNGQSELAIDAARCTRCGLCLEVCPSEAISRRTGVAHA
jgi:ferredoxin